MKRLAGRAPDSLRKASMVANRVRHNRINQHDLILVHPRLLELESLSSMDSRSRPYRCRAVLTIS